MPENMSPGKPGLSLVRVASTFAAGNMIVLAMRFVNTFLTARLVEPYLLGIFNSSLLAVSYAGILQLGVLNGLNRELPYEMGRGDHSRAEELTAAAEAWAILVSAVAFIALAAVSIWYLVAADPRRASAFAVAAVGGIYLLYGQLYLQTTYRTRGDFRKLVLILITDAVMNVFGLALLLAAPFKGLCIRSVAATVISGALLWSFRPVRVRPRWHRAHLVHLLKVGAPIYGVGQLYALWPTINGTLIAARLGASSFGMYAVALMVATGVGVITSSVSQVVYPRMAEDYGRTHDAAAALRPAFKMTAAIAVILGTACVAGWCALPFLIRTVLPKYTGGIAAAQWSLAASALAVLGLPCSIFPVVRRLGMYTAALCCGIAAYAAMVMVFGSRLTLDSFPKALCLGNVVFLALAYLAMLRITRRRVAL
jgi:O-antigen/teichoic acid export membrane protein